MKQLKAIVFDLDNTLVDFMAMKRQAIEAAIDAMVDAGITLERTEIKARIDAIYKEIIEFLRLESSPIVAQEKRH
jgi:beta-phosphoglucomutase-like phosphatase (HAD superfamily)